MLAAAASSSQVDEPGEAGLEHVVIVGDLLGELRQVLDEHRVDHRVFMLGVQLEHLSDGAHVIGEGDAAAPIGRVEAAGGRRDREQLGADALVDVAVRVEGDEVEVVGSAR